MTLPRRQFLQLAAATAGFSGMASVLASGLARPALALDYPSRPVRIIEGLGAGSTPDLVSRLVGQWLSDHLGQPFVIENRTGAGGNVATQAVIAAAPDGYTLLAVTTSNAINASLYEKLEFNFIHDIAPVAGILRFPMVFLVTPSFPANTFPEFIAYAKANPGKVNIASPGIGTPMHVSIEMIKMMTGIDIIHVPYRGPSVAMTDLIAGRMQAFIITVSTASSFVKAGKVRPLAVTVKARTAFMPDVPSIGDTLPGFEAFAWNGSGVPRGTPSTIIDTLSSTITAGLADPQIRTRIMDLGGETVPMPAPVFAKFVVYETDKWAKVVKFAGAKAD
jgi:tripartite-type tricarboxylate transporter receptor subunit TctC